jgi:HTH-type transcriptional regulator/antitoxin HipB
MGSAVVQSSADLGLVIRARRRELGLDQRELAEMVGASRQWVLGIEKGKDRADVGLLLRTLRALGLIVVVQPAPTVAPGDPIDIDRVVERARKP